MNICLLTDSYKLSHHKQYPPKTQTVFSYFESRDGAEFDKTLFFGLQYFLKKYLVGQVVTRDKIDQAQSISDFHMGKGVFNREGWEYILKWYNGRLPVKINAVEEGSLIPTSNVLMTVENTDRNVPWLTNHLETLLSEVWYPCTVATQSWEMRRIISDYLRITGDDPVSFKLHDFGFRGVTCPEQAGIGGAAHLVNFKGTDNIAAIMMLREFYDEEMAGFSIPASEHSTITSWGRENELEAMRNMLEQYPKGLVACVSDSYDIYRACEEFWGTELRDKILNREGALVVRPDSGEPQTVVTRVLQILANKFGFTVNSKGYKVLNPKVRVIQGDGVSLTTLKDILARMTLLGWSTDNISFGSGGALLQKLNRDTQRFAFKCSSVCVNGVDRDVYKDPIGGGKKSKRGRLALTKIDNEYITVTEDMGYDNLLETVFYNGMLVNPTTLEKVRNNAN